MHAVAKRHYEPHVVLDQQYAQTLVNQFAEDPAKGVGLDVVHTCGWLVKQHQRRACRQRAHHFNATLMANHDWPVAAAVSIAFLVLLAGPIAVHQYYRVRQLEQ